MKRIILDTNFLMIPGSLGVDIFSEIRRIIDFSYKIVVLDGTIKELETISKEQKGAKKAAKLGLCLLDRVEILKTEKNGLVDDLILDIVTENDLVGTQDAALKRKLKAKGVDIIVLRKKKYLNVIKT